jgi:hypothetical protein
MKNAQTETQTQTPPASRDAAPRTPVRMIALDLDGTLLKTDKTIGARTVEALRAAHRNGVEIVLASGRMTAAMESTAARLGIDCCIISYNGAVVCGHAAQGRPRLFHQPLNLELARELVAFGKRRRYQINWYWNEVILSEDGPHLRPYIEIYTTRTGSPFQFVTALEDHVHQAPTKLLYVVDPAIRNGLLEEMRSLVGARATMVRTDPEYLEFLEPGVDKGAGLRHLAQILEIPISQVMALGDGENDIPLLQAAGWPVAMANAQEPVKAVARFHTTNDNDHDGVGEAVERWVV